MSSQHGDIQLLFHIRRGGETQRQLINIEKYDQRKGFIKAAIHQELKEKRNKASSLIML